MRDFNVQKFYRTLASSLFLMFVVFFANSLYSSNLEKEKTDFTPKIYKSGYPKGKGTPIHNSSRLIVPSPSKDCLIVPQRTFIKLPKDDFKDIVMIPLCPCIGIIVTSDYSIFASHIDLATNLESLRTTLAKSIFKPKSCSISLFTTDVSSFSEKDLLDNLLDIKSAKSRIKNVQSILRTDGYKIVTTTLFDAKRSNSLYYSKGGFTGFNCRDYSEIEDKAMRIENIFSDSGIRKESDDWFIKDEEGCFKIKNNIATLTEFTHKQWLEVILALKKS